MSRLSLRTELLLNIGLLAAAALLLAVLSVYLLYDVFGEHGALYIAVLVSADLVVLVGYLAYQLDRVMLRPIRAATAAAEAIAAGDLARRLPAGDTREMANLADSVNRMTDRLLEERAHLVRVEKMASVGRLAAGIAHEIGNPLGAINGYTHLLRTAASGTPQATDALAGVDRESARIDRIVRGLLDYARPRHNASSVVDVADTARAVVELLTTQGVLKRVRVRLHTPADTLVCAAGERHELEQAFVNLLLNAVDAMDGRGEMSIVVRRTTRDELRAGARRASDPGARVPNPPSARVLRWLESVSEGSIATVVITDSGPGIPAADAEHVFEPFFTTKPPGKGTGLGLAIVARAIENFGGTIYVSSSREGGAAFRILLPLVSDARASRPRLAAVQPVAVS
ncbi:MAG TPA: ATP-binding protein [Gemmatimonadaceae bacterium]|nr:ATP-binding protein [Gemmatimonadaceae bacterium]